MSTPNTHYGAAAIAQMLDGAKHIHFIGVGGVMMSSLALITHMRGYAVSGTDRTCTAVTRSLQENGVTVLYEHSAQAAVDAGLYPVGLGKRILRTETAASFVLACLVYELEMSE
jgi:UDP-N-acetylmuramate--alanine ligase